MSGRTTEPLSSAGRAGMIVEFARIVPETVASVPVALAPVAKSKARAKAT
nr:hypothetical protein [Methylobacterium nodulans]